MDPARLKLVVNSPREAAKEGRRQRILDAAEFLVEASGSTDFSMEQLARHAGISPHTVYNLVGSKAAVLYILLNRALDRMEEARVSVPEKRDPFEVIFASGDIIIDVYTARPNFFQPLLRFLFGVKDVEYRPAFMRRSYEHWRVAVMALSSAGLMSDGVTEIDMARDLQMFFTGSLEYWVLGEIDADEFRAQIRHGFSMRLLTLSIDAARPALLRNIAAARPVISAVVRRVQAEE